MLILIQLQRKRQLCRGCGELLRSRDAAAKRIQENGNAINALPNTSEFVAIPQDMVCFILKVLNEKEIEIKIAKEALASERALEKLEREARRRKKEREEGGTI